MTEFFPWQIETETGERECAVFFDDRDPMTARVYWMTSQQVEVPDSLWPQLESACLDHLAKLDGAREDREAALEDHGAGWRLF